MGTPWPSIGIEIEIEIEIQVIYEGNISSRTSVSTFISSSKV